LLARADRGRAVLLDELRRFAHVEQVAAYGNVDAERLPDEVAARLVAGTVDWVTLTSPAIAERFAALLPPEGRARIGGEIRLASLSPVTSEAIARLGWTVDAEAREYTWEGLVAAIRRAGPSAQASSR
jgi:uroporphyrinogen III methyltransferase/synthase